MRHPAAARAYSKADQAPPPSNGIHASPSFPTCLATLSLPGQGVFLQPVANGGRWCGSAIASSDEPLIDRRGAGDQAECHAPYSQSTTPPRPPPARALAPPRYHRPSSRKPNNGPTRSGIVHVQTFAVGHYKKNNSAVFIKRVSFSDAQRYIVSSHPDMAISHQHSNLCGELGSPSQPSSVAIPGARWRTVLLGREYRP